MLAGDPSYYQQQQQELTAAFCAAYAPALLGGAAAGAAAAAAARGAAAGAAAAAAAELQADLQQGVADRLCWVPRAVPRKFGRVLPGEVERCRAVAQRHGLLLDPVWTLAAWDAACAAAAESAAQGEGERVAMLHTGGMLGLCGLAQRWPDQF